MKYDTMKVIKDINDVMILWMCTYLHNIKLLIGTI